MLKSSFSNFLHNLIKEAYPEGMAPDYDPPYDLNRWIEASALYSRYIASGTPQNQAWQTVTANWNPVEILDFSHWLKYYSNMEHTKYKIAQDLRYDSVNVPALQRINETLKAQLPSSAEAQQAQLEQKGRRKRPTEGREAIEYTVKSILGRLNAAEKLAANPVARETLQRMLGGQLDSWLEGLHQLKRKLQAAPWTVVAAYRELNVKEMEKTASLMTLGDLMIREGNRSWLDGDRKTAQYLYSLGQAITPVEPATPTTPIEAEPLESGNEEEADEEQSQKAIDEIVRRMNKDLSGAEDGEIDDENWEDENEVVDMVEDPLASITVTAQAMPVQEVANRPKPAIPQQRVVEQIRLSPEDAIDRALSQATIQDVINRLEAVADVFRKREVPRQLAIIDLMMDKLNIGSYFPNLAEASQKSLDSNQYALTRIEDILSKVRGSVLIPLDQQVELTGGNNGGNSGMDEKVRQVLDRDARKEKQEDTMQAQQDLVTPPQAPEGAPKQPVVTNVQEDLTPQPKPVAQQGRPQQPQTPIAR